MSNEELKKKFFDECTTNTTNRITELHGYLPVFNMKPETLWSWIEDNCLQKQGFDIIPYQLCPKCNGQGQVSKPPYIAGDVHEWSSSSCIFPCDVCNGSKIILQFKSLK